MARPRAFSEAEVLDQAMEVFWAQGFEATSVEDLGAATGLSRSSIYQAFESKRGLFDAALEHYVTSRIGGMLETLEGDDTGLDAITAFFDTLAEVADEHPDRFALGCLMTNTIAELGNRDAAVQESGARYVARLRSAFRTALDAAARAGDVSATALEDRAELLVTLALGAFVRARGRVDARGASPVTAAVRGLVATWA